jgi:hypothetical protein
LFPAELGNCTFDFNFEASMRAVHVKKQTASPKRNAADLSTLAVQNNDRGEVVLQATVADRGGVSETSK